MLKEINLSLLLRYGYSGFLLVGILLFVNPRAIKTVTDNSGPVLAPLLVLAVGACIYVVYRYIVGEWILFPLTHWIDERIAVASRGAAISPIRHLRQFGIRERELRAAYNALRHEVLDEKVRKQLDFAHAEIHILFITAIELISLSIFLAVTGATTQVIVTSGLGLIVLCGAVSTDIQQHRSELRSIRSAATEAQIKEHLQSRGFL